MREEDSHLFGFLEGWEVEALVGVTLINDDDTVGVFLSLRNPSDLVILVLIVECLHLIDEVLELLRLLLLPFLELQ